MIPKIDLAALPASERDHDEIAECVIRVGDAGLVLVPVLVLPLGLPLGRTDPGTAQPVPWLLGLLFLSVGLPFFVLSTSAPLLQPVTVPSAAQEPAVPPQQ